MREIKQLQRQDLALRSGRPPPQRHSTLASAQNHLQCWYNYIVKNGETEDLNGKDSVTTTSVVRAMALLKVHG